MEFSSVVHTAPSPRGSLPSPDGNYIASLQANRILLRSPTSLEIKRTIQLSSDFASRIQFMQWSPKNLKYYGKRRSGIDNEEEEGGVQRILVADEHTIEVFDVDDETWTATVVPGLGGTKSVEFGRNADEVLVFSDHQLKLTVWSLRTSKHVDIQHPKFLNKGYSYRPDTFHFALLTRPITHDVVSVHEHTTYRLLSAFTLTTTDAQGLNWSPCGRWIAIWDNAAAGYRVLVFTADGHLFRTYEKPCDGLGVKAIEWSPDSSYLVVACYSGKLTFLGSYLFSPMIEMQHTPTIKTPNVDVWSEEISGTGNRSYALVSQPVNLPVVSSSPTESDPKIGVSKISFNLDGSMVASRDDRMPTTAWIWSIKLLQPMAVLVQLSHIKSIMWHPTHSNLLAIICNAEDTGNTPELNAIYLWGADWRTPRAIKVPLDKLSTGIYGRWINTPSEKISFPLASLSRDGTSSPTSPTQRCVSGSSPNEASRSITSTSHAPTLNHILPMLIFGDKANFIIGHVRSEPKYNNDGPLEQEEKEGDFMSESYLCNGDSQMQATPENRSFADESTLSSSDGVQAGYKKQSNRQISVLS